MTNQETKIATDKPAPPDDWICQRELAAIFDISTRTAAIRQTPDYSVSSNTGFPAAATGNIAASSWSE